MADTLSRLIEMDENIKLLPEDEGKEFGCFPFKEVIECECEIGNINIQHTDPVHVNMHISLPLKDEKLVKLQESDPYTQQLRKQWESNNLDKNMYTMENNILKKTHRQWTFVHTHSSSRHLKGLSPHFGTRQTRTQWFQKNICIT